MKISTKNAPKAFGPYSQAIKINNLLMISGQIPIDIISGNIPENIHDQTILALNYIKEIIIKSNFSLNNIIKTTIFTTCLNKINDINHIYKKFFIQENVLIFPARSCIEVSKLPKNVKIEIEAIALKK